MNRASQDEVRKAAKTIIKYLAAERPLERPCYCRVAILRELECKGGTIGLIALTRFYPFKIAELMHAAANLDRAGAVQMYEDNGAGWLMDWRVKLPSP